MNGDEKPWYLACTEFGYAIDAEDYGRAWKLSKPGWRGILHVLPVFIVFLVATGVLGHTLLMRRGLRGDLGDALVSFLSVVDGSIFMPVYMRFEYRRDRKNRGEIQLHMDASTIKVSTSEVESNLHAWSDFRDWREDGEIVVLRFPNYTFQAIRLRTLSSSKRGQFFDILQSSLPRG